MMVFDLNLYKIYTREWNRALVKYKIPSESVYDASLHIFELTCARYDENKAGFRTFSRMVIESYMLSYLAKFAVGVRNSQSNTALGYHTYFGEDNDENFVDFEESLLERDLLEYLITGSNLTQSQQHLLLVMLREDLKCGEYREKYEPNSTLQSIIMRRRHAINKIKKTIEEGEDTVL